MKAQDLVKGEIYDNVIDPKIPLKFTGQTKRIGDMMLMSIIAYFYPVRTEENKNWYDTIKVVVKVFDEDFGNQYIQVFEENGALQD